MFNSVFSAVGDDHLLRLALAMAAMSLLVTVGLLVQVLSLRVLASRANRRQAEVAARWRPVLVAVAAGETLPQPPLPSAQRVPLMQLWAQLQDGLRGPSHERLVALAAALGFGQRARRWLHSVRDRRRVLALAVLAHLAEPRDAAALQPLLDDHEPEVSLLAARALLRVDSAATCAQVLDRYLQRPDWPLAQVGTLLMRAADPRSAAMLADRLDRADAPALLRLLPLVGVVQGPETDAAVGRLLQRASDPEVLAAALALARGPEPQDRVRELSRHADWRVRSAAAQALGRVGGQLDRRELVSLLSDPQWWVRYRAAQTLLGLPGFDAVDQQALAAGLHDRFARDILAQVQAEQRLQASGTAP